MEDNKTYTQDELNLYIKLRRELDGFGSETGLKLDLAYAKEKVDRHGLGDDLNKFLNRDPQHDVDAEEWVKISAKVSEVQKKIKELENKIIFANEISMDD